MTQQFIEAFEIQKSKKQKGQWQQNFLLSHLKERLKLSIKSCDRLLYQA